MTLNHNYGYFSGVGSGIAGNVLQLYAVVCRLCAVGKLRIGAVISWAVLELKFILITKNKNQ